MDIDQMINKHESAVDRQMARRIISDWESGGPYAHNMVRTGLQMLAVGNKPLADDVYTYLQEEMGY